MTKNFTQNSQKRLCNYTKGYFRQNIHWVYFKICCKLMFTCKLLSDPTNIFTSIPKRKPKTYGYRKKKKKPYTFRNEFLVQHRILLSILSFNTYVGNTGSSALTQGVTIKNRNTVSRKTREISKKTGGNCSMVSSLNSKGEMVGNDLE